MVLDQYFKILVLVVLVVFELSISFSEKNNEKFEFIRKLKSIFLLFVQNVGFITLRKRLQTL